MACGHLVALHPTPGPPQHPLPSQGSLTIGRRPNCTIVCGDAAVSGVHCVVSVASVALHELACEVEDRSTNGTFVNDVRLSKGQRMPVSDGDIISLTKPIGAEGEDSRS